MCLFASLCLLCSNQADFVKELAASCGVVCHMRTWGDAGHSGPSSSSSGGGIGVGVGVGVVPLAGAGMHANAREWRRREASAIRASRVRELGIAEKGGSKCIVPYNGGT
jgi:hypothetical protein